MNAVTFLAVILILTWWKSPKKVSTLPPERFSNAMRLGIRFAKNSPELQAVMIRTVAFIIPASAIWALLPLITKQLLGGDSSDYGILLASIGTGAVGCAALLPRLKKNFSVDALVGTAIFLMAIVVGTLGFIDNFIVVIILMFFTGMSWLTILSILNVAAQTSIPSWVRARAMAIYFMLVFFGGMALGSLFWGIFSNYFGIPIALYCASATLIIGLLATSYYKLSGRECLDLSPSMHWPSPLVNVEPDYNDGPVLVTIEHMIDPKNASEFAEAMEKVRKARLRDGALRWDLYQDLENPRRFMESFIVESWAEHLRQHDRVTEADRLVQERARAYHNETSTPKVSHLILIKP